MILKNVPMAFAALVAAVAVFGSDQLHSIDDHTVVASASFEPTATSTDLLIVGPEGLATAKPVDPVALAEQAPAHLVVTNPSAVEGMTGLQAVLYADSLPPRPVPITVAARRESQDKPSGASMLKPISGPTQFAAADLGPRVWRPKLHPD